MSRTERNAVTVKGSGPTPLVFVHGVGCSQQAWQYVAPRFEMTNTVVLYDLTGCGRSDAHFSRRRNYKSLRGHVDDLIDICAEHARGGALIVAHSFGAMIALRAARERPDLFEHLVLLSASPCHRDIGEYAGGLSETEAEELLDAMDRSLPAWSAHLAPIAVGPEGRPEVISELEGYFSHNDQKAFSTMMRLSLYSDLRGDLAKIETPCTLITTWNDPFVSDVAHQYLLDHLPHVESQKIMTGGHYPHLNDPEHVTAALRAVFRA